MDSESSHDLFSTLSNSLLVLIVSFLPFKDALKTSVLSTRWRNIYRQTRNISFNESMFVRTRPVTEDEQTKRAEFVQYMVGWVSNFSSGVIETFELSLSNPVGFEVEMETLIEFAAIREVKNLVLDFSDHGWNDSDDAEAEEASMIQIPESVYKLTNLVTLKILACRVDLSRVVEAGSLESLYFGWIQLNTITSLLSKAPLLKILLIKNCWKVGLEAITGYNNRLIKLAFKNCRFAVQSSTLDLPSILIFKYSGNIHHFELTKVNRSIEEAHLDFEQETRYHDGMGRQLNDLLCNILSATTLTVCPFLIEVIQDSIDPVRLKAEMETKWLVLKTNLEPREFIGIRFMINSCPYLETLCFQLVVTRPVDRMVPEFDPRVYWSAEIIHKCMKNTLKNVEMWNFCGGTYELHVLKYLIRYGRVLEQVDLYLPSGIDDSEKLRLRAAAETLETTFKANSERLSIYVH